MRLRDRIAAGVARRLAPRLVVSRILAGRPPALQPLFRRTSAAVLPHLTAALARLAHAPARAAIDDEFVRFASTLGLDHCLALAGDALSAGEPGLARRLYAVGSSMPGAQESVRARWLAHWLAPTGARVPATRSTPAPTARLAVIDYRHPDLFRASINIGDWVQTTALLGNIARRAGVAFTGDAGLAGFADRLRARVAEGDRVTSGGTLELSAIQRDVSGLDDIAPQTWLFAYGWYMWPRYAEAFDFPFNGNLLPIFISFHCNVPELLTPQAEAYLREHGPVGCRDWSTVELLQSRDIPAFFSGCVTTTLGHVARRTLAGSEAATLPVAWVDLEAPEGAANAVALTQADADVLQRDVTANLDTALGLLDDYRDRFASVHTSRLHCYLPCRALGTPVEIVPPDPDDIRFAGLLGIDDDAFERMADGISHKISAALGWILAGDPPEEVYDKWRSLCAPEVAAALSRRAA
jgi:hypothetical protein